MENYLVMQDVTRIYNNGIIANDKVNFSARKGEIHAICGENGAGKTTLMKMLFGIEQPDEGKIIVKGEEKHLKSPSDAIASGIGMVHQHFMQVPSLTVAENVTLGIEPTKGLVFDKAKAVEITRECCQKYGFDINPLAEIQDLSVGVKQKVEIVKALVKGCDILILDEPTAVLTPQETKELFVQLKHLREQGCTIIFISHKLNEVMELCDHVTVIKRGKTIGVWDIKDVTEADISRYMVGVDVNLDIPKKPAEPKENVLTVNNLTVYNEAGKKKVDDVSFSVRKGEIVGIAGVEGNGQRELIDVITGLAKYSYGSIKLLDKEVKDLDIKGLRTSGMVHIPEDRNLYGVAKNWSIRDNMVADKIDLPKYNKGILLNEKAIKEDTTAWVDEYRVLCDDDLQQVGMLSGGNVQKVVVAREFESYSELVITDQPTRGIDVGAAEFVRTKMVELRDAGKAIILISADLAEVMSLSDSLIVMHGGKINAYFKDVKKLSEEELGFYMLGVKHMSEEEIREALHE